jgi:hypothetical protein
MTYAGIAAKVEIAFVANPYGTLTWTDVTAQVVSLKTTSGRNYETGKNESSTVNLVLRNQDGRFNPLNPSSPYAPNVLPFRPVRITAAATSGGTVYPVWYGYVQRWPQSVKDQTSQYEIVQLTGVDAFKAVLGFVPGDPYDVKVRKDYGAYVAPGLTSGVGSGTVTKVQPSPCRTGIIFGGTQALVVGTGGTFGYLGEMWINPTTLPSVPKTGQIIAAANLFADTSPIAEISLSGIRGAEKVNANSTTSNTQANTCLLLIANLVNVMPSDNAASFETSVADWTSETPARVTIAQGTNANVGSHAMRATLTAAAGGNIALTTRFPVTAGYQYQVSLAGAPSVTTASLAVNIRWYNGAGALLSTTTNTTAALPTAAYQGVNQNPMLAPAGAVTGSVILTPTLTSGTAATVDFDAIMVVGGSTNASCQVGTVMYYVDPSAGATVSLAAQFASTSGSNKVDQYVVPAPTVGAWHHLAWTSKYVVATSVFAVDGVAQTSTGSRTTGTNYYQCFQNFGGTSYNNTKISGGEYQGAIAGVWAQTTADANIVPVSAVYAAQHYNYGTTASGGARTHDFPSELTSQRVNDVLMAIAFPPAMIALETGLTTMTASGNVSGTTATALIEAAADAELGNVFVDASGIVTFHNRNHRNNLLPAADSGFEGTVGSWVAGSNWTVTDDTTHALVGGYSLKCVRLNSTAGNGYTATSSTCPASASAVYTASASLYADTTTAGKTFLLSIHEGPGGASYNQNVTLGAAGTWTPVRTTFTTSSTATNLKVFVTDDPQGAPAAGQTMWVDEVSIYPTSVATFGGDGAIPYEGNIVIDFDDTYVYNDAQITQAGASPSYVYEIQDVTSQNTYGVRSLTQSVQVVNQSDVQGMGATLLARYKDPHPRLATLSFELRSKPSYLGQVMALKIGDPITVNHKPLGGTTYTLQVFIDGISHTVDEGQWLITFNTTPLYPNTTY